MMNSLWSWQDRLGKQSFGRGAVKPRGEREGDASRGLAALPPKTLTRAKTIPPATQVSWAKI